ncbi:MAG TPA: tetratricopeptide repeat protein, partial [Candidatus Poseidoniaceae archaeon]|nr:tetratricopeptide repeat protein [Candidatus Poseidoniaceae archaeon]
RGQREHTMALEKAFSIVRRKPQMVKARVSLALCLLDQGEWHLALDVYESLAEMAAADPRTEGLGEILGVPTRGYDDLSAPIPHEVLLSSRRDNESKKYLSKLKPYVKEAPTNPAVGLHFKKKKDVSLSANAMIAADQSVMRAVEPRYRVSNLVLFIRFFLLWPSFVAVGWWASTNLAQGYVLESASKFVWPIVTGTLFFIQFVFSRISRSQRRIIKQTEQKGMIAYAKRLKRSRVDLTIDKVPIGNHMLISGILVTISNAVYDIGLPGWLTVRLEKPKNLRSNLRTRSKQIRSSKSPRYKNLPYEWWKNQPRALSKESQDLKKKIGLVLQDFGGKKKSNQKKLRQKSRNMSSLGLEGDSIIYSGDKPKRTPKGKPPSRNNNSQTDSGDEFDIESFLDSKRR